MPAPVRKRGIDISVYTLDGDSMICDLEDCEITIEVEDEDGRGACDDWSYFFAVARSWSISYNGFVPASAALIADAVNANDVSVVINSGANSYTGAGIMTSANHKMGRSGLQRQGCTIKGRGALVVVPPA